MTSSPSQISPSTIPLPGLTISQMPAATLPLSGQELIPLVQLGNNVRTSVSGIVGSSGGILTANQISTGTTAPLALLASINIWNSSTAGAKTQPIPASVGSFYLIVISDKYGALNPSGGASTYAITAVPQSGSIIGNNAVYSNGSSITLIDTPYGWVSI
jgi:hypothetical protein